MAVGCGHHCNSSFGGFGQYAPGASCSGWDRRRNSGCALTLHPAAKHARCFRAGTKEYEYPGGTSPVRSLTRACPTCDLFVVGRAQALAEPWQRHIRRAYRICTCSTVAFLWLSDKIAIRLLAAVGASCESRSLRCGAVSQLPSRVGHPLSQTERPPQQQTSSDEPDRSAPPIHVLYQERESIRLRAALGCAVSALAPTGEKHRSCESRALQRHPSVMNRHLFVVERCRFAESFGRAPPRSSEQTLPSALRA